MLVLGCHRAVAQCETYKRTGIAAGFEPAGGGYAEYVRVMPFVLPGVVKIPAKIWSLGAPASRRRVLHAGLSHPLASVPAALPGGRPIALCDSRAMKN